MRRSKLARTRGGRKSNFGCVFKLQRRDGRDYSNWSARWVEGGRRVQRGGFATKDAAEDFLARQRVEQSERRALGLPELQRVSVEDGIKRYLAWSKEHRRLGTHKSNSTYLTALAAKWGGRDLISLTGNDVVRALEEIGRERRWSPSTLHCGLTTMGAFLRWATQERMARDGILRGARRRLPRMDQESPPYLPPDEVRGIYTAVPEEIRAVVVLMGEAGLRRNEAIYLRRDEVARDLASVTSVVWRRTPPHSLQWASVFLFVSFAIPVLRLSDSRHPPIAARDTRNASDDPRRGKPTSDEKSSSSISDRVPGCR